jgi:asparagine synthase (glutamine-hydrolysing)
VCGIVGYVNLINQSIFEDDLDRSIASISHRGPNYHGKRFLNEKSNIGFGHSRLSILDTSLNGHQPMESSTGRFIIIFNGEIYNHKSLRKSISNTYNFDGWKSNSDTETLVNLIELEGMDLALEKCIGMFSLAVYDKKLNMLYLARDRIGEKPLYFFLNSKCLLFGSELKALMQFKYFEKHISMSSLATYFRLNYIPSPYSIFKNTFKCPQGSYISFDLNEFNGHDAINSFENLDQINGLEVKKYFTLENAINCEKYHDQDIERATVNLDNILTNAVERQLISDVPLGAFLSGGIDSSLIVSLMQKVSSKKIKTFTIGFEDKRYDESSYAYEVAKHLGTDHQSLILSESETLEIIPNLTKIYDEPFADSSQIPTFLVSQLAKTKVTVSLSGDGGDEFFGGYNRYSMAPRLWDKISILPFPIRNLFAQSLMLTPNSILSCIEVIYSKMNKNAPVQMVEKIQSIAAKLKYVKSKEELFHSLISHYENPNEMINYEKEQSTIFENTDIWSNNNLCFEEKMMLTDALTYLADDILCKVDRASMANSLESRAPFLDHTVIEESFKLPLSFKIRNNKGKYILRKILKQYIPEKLIERPKQGFGIPLKDWINGPLNSTFRDYLSEDALSHNLLNNKKINQMFNEHMNNDRNWQHQLWAIYTFQKWMHENDVSI